MKRARFWAVGLSVASLMALVGLSPVAASPVDQGGAASPDELFSVSAVATNDVLAVGVSESMTPVAEHFNGVKWRAGNVPLPPGVSHGLLYGVASASADDGWAVGSTRSGICPCKPIIEHWDGAHWSLEDAPFAIGELKSVDVVSPDDVWAVGYFAKAGVKYPLTLHYDGDDWTRIPTPTEARGSVLSSVSGVTGSDVWTVGKFPGHQMALPLAMHWDGSTWSISQTAATPPKLVTLGLRSVVAVASDDVWLSGEFSKARPLIEHFDGAIWSRVRAPGPGTIYGIGASSAGNVWAVGETNTKGAGSGLGEHWDGSTWTRTTADPPPGFFLATAPIAADDVWAVGANFGLIDHYDGSTWTAVHL